MNKKLGRVGYLMLFLALAVSAWAHMKVGKTMPQNGAVLSESPETIRIWYTQEPDFAVSKIALEGPDGASDLELEQAGEQSLSATVEGGLSNGEYQVLWQTAGDDGHIQKGEFSFTVRTSE